MQDIQLSRSEYRDKVFACWLGKNIGGTLGAPFEGQKSVRDIRFYDPVPDASAPNDDLDFQLVWLKMLEDRSGEPTLPNLAEYWIRYLSAYPWNEYGFCRRNLERGLMPPISGCFENYFVDEMGSPIRSEIWACIAPGDPQRAAAMAWKDSALDHAGGEGTYGEMFWAAVESAGFVLSDPKTLIRIGLAMIPVSCLISRVIREALWCSEHEMEWAEARERIVTYYGHYQACHAVQNQGFIILGWLYGEDFGDKLCKAVNCGYDTDCTGATLGSVLGILGGTASIPEAWSKPIGETIVLHHYTGAFNAPATIGELTDRTQVLAERFIAEKSETVAFAERTYVPEEILSLLFRNESAIAALRQDIHAAVAVGGDLEITLHYGGEPVLRPGIRRTVEVTLQKEAIPVDAEVELEAPDGWVISMSGNKSGYCGFDILASQVADRNRLVVTAKLPDGDRQACFTILGPGEAEGYPSGTNVPK
jgi:ADP-ribosylglycohydrolase